MEYWVKDQFVPVLKQKEGGAVLTLKKEADAVWNYYQNWTMGRLVGNEFVSLNLTGIPSVRAIATKSTFLERSVPIPDTRHSYGVSITVSRSLSG